MTEQQNQTVNVVGVIFVFALVIMAIQSCLYTSNNRITDEMVIEAGRKRFLQTAPKGEVEFLDEEVLRPGLGGDEFGYWLKYRIKDADGNWVEKEHYDE